MSIRIFVTIFLLFQALVSAFPQSFSDFFDDATLRIDYTLAGDASSQSIYFNSLSSFPHWYGRHQNLSSTPVHGNGQVEVSDVASGKIIYVNGFSSLFQEWQSYDEAKCMSRAFEGVTLVPMPRRPVKVTLRLFDSYINVAAEVSCVVNPSDILIRRQVSSNPYPYDVIRQPADEDNCIRLAIIAEGYTEAEMPSFLASAREAADAIFSHSPFKEFADMFQVVAVKSVSAESGVSVPSKGRWVNNLLGSNFDSFYADRYLTTLNISRLHDVLSGIPYEHVIILANSSTYGGGGILNFYTIASAYGQSFRSVIVHEFGHAFAGLADEYAYEGDTPPMYPLSIEPWEDNITTLVNYSSKWKDLEGQPSSCGTVGLYEGAGYSLKGIFRPTPNCRMHDNLTADFCPVCQRAIRRVIGRCTSSH